MSGCDSEPARAFKITMDIRIIIDERTQDCILL